MKMIDQAREFVLFKLAKALYTRNAGQSEEMTAALKDSVTYEQYRSGCLKKITDAADRFSIQITHHDVLDLGCYDGALTSSLLKLSPKSIIGTDIDKVAVQTARQKYADQPVEFHVNTAQHLPVADRSVDTIVSYDVFEHVADPSAVLAECRRVLRPGGQLLIGTWGWYHPFAPHLWSVMPVPWAHVLFSERVMLRVCRRVYESDWYVPNMHDFDKEGIRIPQKFCNESIPTDYLNKHLIADFERVFEASGIDFQIHPERFSSPLACWTAPMLKVPYVKEFFTSYIWCVLSKPNDVGLSDQAERRVGKQKLVAVS